VNARVDAEARPIPPLEAREDAGGRAAPAVGAARGGEGRGTTPGAES